MGPEVQRDGHSQLCRPQPQPTASPPPAIPGTLTNMSKKEVLKLYSMISLSKFFSMPSLVWRGDRKGDSYRVH